MDSLTEIVRHILQLRETADRAHRLMVGIAGAPGSGKSTLAEALVPLLNSELAARCEKSVVVPMDGFHLDNRVLQAHGTQQVKGSPQTFDALGFLALLQRLRLSSPDVLYAPVFDRNADLSRNAAQEVHAEHTVVLVEGNYLLLDQPIWRDIPSLLDCSIALDVPMETLEQRLIERWLHHDHSEAEALERAQANDLPNARLVLSGSVKADLYFKSVRQ